uniref:Si:dkey-35m8.1 n=1 Tax=Oryzias sinensis TaxID=183150 RepID=A0A8C7XTH2_9TELE
MLSREKKKEEEAGFALDLGFLPHAASMFSCVGCFWVLLSSALVAVCSFSFISPAWIVKEQPRSGHQHPHPHDKGSVSFGLLWHCSESLDRMYRCYTFGGLGRFAEIPSSSWQTSAVLCSGGCALLAVSSLLAIITVFLPSGGCERRACTLAGYMQMAAGGLTPPQHADARGSQRSPREFATTSSTLYDLGETWHPSSPGRNTVCHKKRKRKV